MSDRLSELRELVLDFRDRREWAAYHRPKDLALGLTSEVGELAETVLWKTDDELHGMATASAGRDRVAEELADVMIYLLYLADAFGIDIGEAVTRKVRLNEAKYPVERARGNAKKYTEFGE